MPQLPTLVVLNETFLTQAISEIQLEGYTLVARRDRRDQWGGGVAVFVAAEQFSNVSVVETSDVSERIWIVVHTDRGPYLVCNWYRPPAPGDVSSIASLRVEWEKHKKEVRGTLIIGDANVHSIRWLHFSSGESAEGSALQDVCHQTGMHQVVKEPTRGEHLLDIAITDISSASARVVASIADHKGVLATIPFSMPKVLSHHRQVWHYRDADWDRLRDELGDADWEDLAESPPDAAADQLVTRILQHTADCIPQRTVKVWRSTHPWLTERAVAATLQKHAAEGTDAAATAATHCSAVMMEEFHKYIDATKQDLTTFRQGSKAWWGKARRLLEQKAQVFSIPALRVEKKWILQSKDKASAFVDSFAAKNKMIGIEHNEHSDIGILQDQQADEAAPSVDDVRNVLEKLDVDSATGPDLLPARILKMCAAELADPVHKLVLSILRVGKWPAAWMRHWICPLHKRKATCEPGNYRGIHLTPQLSKVVERVLQSMWVPTLIRVGAFGENQFAYLPARGSRDALALAALTWITCFARGQRVAVYCSDVSGAFDKVQKTRLA